MLTRGQNVLICRATELGMLSGIAAILRFPISDPDENEDENGADSSSNNDWYFTFSYLKTFNMLGVFKLKLLCNSTCL